MDLFTHTLKVLTTPGGRRVPAIRASLAASDAHTSWPTTGSKDGDKSVRTLEGAENEAARKGWSNDLCTAALASWPTTQAQDVSGGGQAKRAMGDTRHGSNLNDFAMLAAWPTAAARDWKGATRERWGTNARPLNEVVVLAGWGTPDCPRKNDSEQTAGKWYPSMLNRGLVWQAAQLAGTGSTPTGYLAATAKPGQLNPAHSRWLMGLSPAWDACAPMATRSSSRKPKSGSKL